MDARARKGEFLGMPTESAMRSAVAKPIPHKSRHSRYGSAFTMATASGP